MISILLPTRRPNNLRRFVESVRLTATNIEIVAYVDEDDAETAYAASELGINFMVGPKLMFTDYWNKCYEKASADILMMAADDLIFRTSGWDEMVEEAFQKCADKICLVHGNDLHPRVQIPSHPIIHRKWAEAVGYFSPPYFPSGACDIWLYEVAWIVGRFYSLPFVHEHMHPSAGKCAVDDLYKYRASLSAEATKIYQETFDKRMEDAAKLINVIEEYEKIH